MIKLNYTTLFSFCWGAKYFEATLKSVLSSQKYVTFDKCIIASNIDISKYSEVLNSNKIDILHIDINLNDNLENDDNNRQHFSSLFLNTLHEACTTDYILTIQQDSGVIFPEKWSNGFFDYDYIGAPWPMEIIQASDMVAGKITKIKNIVGNGGFSLRSKKYVDISRNLPTYHKNEDLNICIFNYDEMKAQNIKFAPPEIAVRFAVEHPIKNLHVFDRNFLPTYQSFGFHGNFNKAGINYINQ